MAHTPDAELNAVLDELVERSSEVLGEAFVGAYLQGSEVASKSSAVRWAMSEVDQEWEPLLAQVLTDRGRGFDLADAPAGG